MPPAPASPASDSESSGPYGLRQWLGCILGPAAVLATLLLPPPDGLSVAGWHATGAAALMAIFWICESIPIPATALLPLVLFPALRLSNIAEVAAPFANPIIFLFLGGFLLALAMQRWGLHRRIALNLIGALGTRPSRIVGGFLLASSFISMWVSNTATALMMLPIALSVVHLLPADDRASRHLRAAILLAVAYGATVGGMATLIGTPPTALLAAYMTKVYGVTLGFGQWMLLGVPLLIINLFAVHFVLTRLVFKLARAEVPGLAALIAREKAALGPANRGEWVVAVVFSLTAAGWIFQPLFAETLPLLTDTTIAMAGGLLLFFIPANARRGEFVMNWESTKGLPWDILLLFGGGLTLAATMEKHGLSVYLGSLCSGLNHLPVLVPVAIVCFGTLLLTELTSNTATAAAFLPVASAIAISLGQNPLLFIIPAVLAASCSFMLPVGTPPNAIVFGSGHLTLPQMARAGLLLNLLMVPIILGLLLLLGPLVFDLHLNQLPAWAK